MVHVTVIAEQLARISSQTTGMTAHKEPLVAKSTESIYDADLRVCFLQCNANIRPYIAIALQL